MFKLVSDFKPTGDQPQAIEKANEEYEKYRIKQDMQYISSMDEMYQKYLEENK